MGGVGRNYCGGESQAEVGPQATWTFWEGGGGWGADLQRSLRGFHSELGEFAALQKLWLKLPSFPRPEWLGPAGERVLGLGAAHSSSCLVLPPTESPAEQTGQ